MEPITSQLYDHIYLSPHYDDASLSCGGAIHRQVQAGQSVLVITICAAPPQAHEPLSTFADALHKAWGNPEDIVVARQAEDTASMAILGVDYRRLDFTDCIYRGDPQREVWYYNSVAELFGQIHPADLILADKIADTLSATVDRPSEMICAPLTVGHHVDHQLTHIAAWQLRRRGWPLAFYEDYPYSDPNYPFTRDLMELEPRHTLEATLAAKQSTTPLQADLRYLAEENLTAKIDSVRAYGSQLAMLFDGPAAMATHVRNYARRVGQGRAAERIWVPDNNC